eukprot:gene21347-23423_t
MSSDEIHIRQRVKEKQSSSEEEGVDEKPAVEGKRKKGGDTRSGRPNENGSKSVPVVKPPKKKKKKDDNLTGARLIAYLMISPSLIYVINLLYNVISRYSLAGKFYHVTALLLSAVTVTCVCVYFYKSIQPYLKYMAVFSLLIFIVPTVQVYRCSPIHLHNKDLGKTFKLREGADNFMKIAYLGSQCWKNQSFKTPYDLAMYTPSLKLTVKPYQIVNLMMHHFNERGDDYEGPPVDALPNLLYLLTSQRSVKRQMFNLNLLTMVPGRIEIIAGIMELGIDDRENVTLDIYGKIGEMGLSFNDTKAQLEEMEYMLRPLVFHVYKVEVFGVPEEQTENPDEYFADRSTWKKKQPKRKDEQA